ncbi:unnamed protein product [Pleuronectes platessa]|uniref:Uncharacterized protein n=1 Tax=Pleuronectes platessa TaxID=8262 RepID=A0A9N7VTP8_PLEPL|nr:unnamed protein product [Pleuronectes platessa]
MAPEAAAIHEQNSVNDDGVPPPSYITNIIITTSTTIILIIITSAGHVLRRERAIKVCSRGRLPARRFTRSPQPDLRADDAEMRDRADRRVFGEEAKMLLPPLELPLPLPLSAAAGCRASL